MNPLNALTTATRTLFAAPAGHAGFTLQREPDLLAAWGPSPSPLLNYVLDATITDSPQALVDRVFDAADGRGFVWKLPPGSPAGLADVLLANGFVELPPSVPIWGPIPDAVDTIAAAFEAATPVRDGAAYRKWLVPFQAAFGVGQADADHLHAAAVSRGFASEDPVQHVFIERDGHVVAAGTLVTDGGPMAGAFNIAVDPEARRQKLGTAILAALAKQAHDRGCTHIGQFSTVEGVPLYTPHGDVHDDALRNLVWMGGPRVART